MKKELYWFKFYPDNWLIGDITIEDYEVQGVFINLCAYYWKRGENGVAMARLKARYRDVKAGVWERLIESEVIKVDENQVVNIRFLDDQRSEILKEKEFLSNSGKKGAEKRWGSHSNREVDTDIEVEKEVKNINIEFEIFWNLYDKKIGDKTKIEKKWIKLSDQDRENIIRYIPKYKASTEDKKFRKNPETFLNNKSWNDEIIGSEKKEEVSGRRESDNIPLDYGVRSDTATQMPASLKKRMKKIGQE